MACCSSGKAITRVKVSGTCKKARYFSDFSPDFFNRTPIFKVSFARKGNGRVESTAIGVKTGKISCSKKCFKKLCCVLESCSGFNSVKPSRFSAGNKLRVNT